MKDTWQGIVSYKDVQNVGCFSNQKQTLTITNSMSVPLIQKAIITMMVIIEIMAEEIAIAVELAILIEASTMKELGIMDKMVEDLMVKEGRDNIKMQKCPDHHERNHGLQWCQQDRHPKGTYQL
jgi:hypothetical protein